MWVFRNIVLIFTVMILSGCCDAETFQRWGIPGDTFASTDMSPVKVNSARCNFTKPSDCVQRISKTFEIPRAYIISALPYTIKQHCTVPDEIFGARIQLGINFPDGKPVTVVRGASRADPNARYSDMFVELFFPITSADNLAPLPVSEIKKKYIGTQGSKPDGGTWRNLTRYRGRVYLGDAGEGIVRITCTANFEKALKIHYCKYYAIFGDGIEVRADFLDFRLNGDLEMARERMRVIRKTVCGFVECKS